MEFTGSYTIPASRNDVWDALNNPDILEACIPGCEALASTGENQFEATVFAKVGPVQARFKGSVSLQNLEPPAAYDLVFDGSGGVAGFAKGNAVIKLEEADNETVLTYTANAKIGGKLAQIGQRLVDSSARKMADDFFSEFCQLANTGFDPNAEPASTEARAPVTQDEPDDTGSNTRVITGVIIAAVILAAAIFFLA